MDKIERATEIHRTMTPHQMALRIVELQDELELAEEAVRAKKQAVPEGWQLVPVKITPKMGLAGNYFMPSSINCDVVLDAMRSAAPKPEGGAA